MPDVISKYECGYNTYWNICAGENEFSVFAFDKVNENLGNIIHQTDHKLYTFNSIPLSITDIITEVVDMKLKEGNI